MIQWEKVVDVTDGKISKSTSFQVIIEENHLMGFLFLAAGAGEGGWGTGWGGWGGWGGGAEDRERRGEEKEAWKGAFVSLAEGVPRGVPEGDEGEDLMVLFRFLSLSLLEGGEIGEEKFKVSGKREGKKKTWEFCLIS